VRNLPDSLSQPWNKQKTRNKRVSDYVTFEDVRGLGKGNFFLTPPPVSEEKSVGNFII